jgi:uncharacterized membrane protein/predicted DsbA family dithiol-disulfide isomerase
MSARAEAERSAIGVLRGFALAALVFSSAAAAEYFTSHGAFCAPGSGCDAVRASAIGRTIGLALPPLGMIGFAGVVLATLSRSRRTRLFGLAFALTGGLVGLVLIALQAFVVRAFCWLCTGADLCALAAGVCALPLLRRTPAWREDSARAAGAWRAALVVAAFAPPAWAVSQPTRIPAYVRSLGEAGKINVIEFSDFECPFCRALHPVLSAAIAPYGTRVHFVRETFPLKGHVHAREAARAYLCARMQGRGDAMADWLFGAGDLSAANCTKAAAALGLDLSRFIACLVDPATEATVARDAAEIEAADFRGLPTVWIGAQRILGFDKSAGAARYTDALARAANHEDTRMRVVPLAVVAVLALLALRPALRRR